MASTITKVKTLVVMGIFISTVALAQSPEEAKSEILQESTASEAPVLTQADYDAAEKAFSLIEMPEGMNGVPLLGKRFRIDHRIKEINLLFFRESGSPAVVLVRPDGSKFYVTTYPDDRVEWYDEKTFDLIKIRDPMPGPWQAVGRLVADSQIMVVSELQLHVDPLPPFLISGEVVKLTARVTNGGKPIEQGLFQDVVNLDVTFRSSNNESFGNFGMKAQKVASFRDNGQDFDEVPLDGIFTGKFDLNIAAGEWLPEYAISTPMFARELRSEPVIVHPNPIVFSQELTDIEGDYHEIFIEVSNDAIDPESVLYNGELTYPDGEVHEIAINQPDQLIKTIEAVNYTYGIFRVKLTAFATNKNGRDIVLDVPEYTFLVEEPEIVIDCTPILQIDESKPEGQQQVFVVPLECQQLPPETSMPSTDDAMTDFDLQDVENQDFDRELTESESANTDVATQENNDSGGMWLAIIIGANLLLILLGGLVLKFVVFRKKKIDVNFDNESGPNVTTKGKQNKASDKKQAVENSSENERKNTDSDDLIDLNLDDKN